MTAGKRLPSEIFAVRIRTQQQPMYVPPLVDEDGFESDEEVHPGNRATEVYIYRTESAAAKHMKNAVRFMYHDETAELLGTQLTWTPLADVAGDLERD